MKKLILSILWIILIAYTGCESFPYEFEGSNEHFEIYSQIQDDSYTIYVYLPPNYSKTDKYPLIIGLDADAEFSFMEDIVSDQIINGKIPPAIFVGIGYGSTDQNELLRNRDYTPSQTSDPDDYETGKATKFYTFIKDELIPELENKYPINEEGKTLLGHSFGGLFTFFAMFQARSDNPFDKFIPVAASFWYDAGVLFEYEQKYAEAHTDLPVKVYTSMGTLEGAVMLNYFQEMEERMQNRNYASLSIKYQLLKKYGHSRSDYISYEKGLEYVFKP